MEHGRTARRSGRAFYYHSVYLTRKLHLTPVMQAYVQQNLSDTGFGFDNSQSSGMKTFRDAG